MIWLKAPEKANKWTLKSDCFVHCFSLSVFKHLENKNSNIKNAVSLFQLSIQDNLSNESHWQYLYSNVLDLKLPHKQKPHCSSWQLQLPLKLQGAMNRPLQSTNVTCKGWCKSAKWPRRSWKKYVFHFWWFCKWQLTAKVGVAYIIQFSWILGTRSFNV